MVWHALQRDHDVENLITITEAAKHFYVGQPTWKRWDEVINLTARGRPINSYRLYLRGNGMVLRQRSAGGKRAV
jgi:hypothetical protein